MWWTWVACAWTPAPGAEAAAPAELGRWPLCEPSAALTLDDGALLVADNEGRPAKKRDPAMPTLWVVPLADGAPTEPRPVRREESKLDAEALVRLGDELWIVGSGSRDKACERKPGRWRIEVGRPAAFTAEGLGAMATERVLSLDGEVVARLEADVASCVRELFPGEVPLAAEVCAAIVEGARAAAAGEGCASTPNVEGAAAWDGRVWLGLRAPVVDGHAVLARLAPSHDRWAFDAVRLVDLGGLGIRELAVDGDRLVGLAGAPADGGAGTATFAVPLAALSEPRVAADLGPRDLPPTTEAFARVDGSTLFLVDGDAGDGPSCKHPAGWLLRPR